MTDDPETELHPIDFPDDIKSVYQNEDMADNEESLNDLLISLGENQAGPSDSVGEKEKTLESIILFIKGAPLWNSLPRHNSHMFKLFLVMRLT